MRDEFEQHRQRLFSLAYRMLGSAHDAEDVVQTAWLRWSAATDVQNPAAFLSTVGTRLCLDELGSARRRREAYVGPWLPEPVLTAELGPLETVEQREQVTLGALLLLERLTPQQRAVCVLRDAFDYPYRAIGEILGLPESSCRQLYRRGRVRLQQDAEPAGRVDDARVTELGMRLFAAAAAGDLAQLEQLLAADVVLVSDGGGLASAARRPVVERSKVARFLVGVTAKTVGRLQVSLADVNGTPALLGRLDGSLSVAVFLTSDGACVHRIDIVANPEKLARLDAATA